MIDHKRMPPEELNNEDWDKLTRECREILLQIKDDGCTKCLDGSRNERNRYALLSEAYEIKANPNYWSPEYRELADDIIETVQS